MTPALDSKWVSYRAAGYLRGRGVVYGCGHSTPFPIEAKAPGIYAIVVDPNPHPLVSLVESTDISVLKPRSMDFIFAGVNTPWDILPRLVELLKVDGHLICHTLIEDTAETRERITRLGGWKAKILLDRGPASVTVAKLVETDKCWISLPKLRSSKTACIGRYGAIGDMIMVTPLIRALAEKGYKVTVNTTTYSADVLLNNPYVHNVIIQERNIVPNNELGPYWDEWRQDYDLYINLSESIEGGLLKLENRADFYTPAAKRRELCNINYTDRTLELGQCSDAVKKTPELYFSSEEIRAAKQFLKSIGAKPETFVIMWGLNGSSYHKSYPATEMVLREWLPQHPNVKVILTGDARAQALEFDMPGVYKTSGRLSLRLMLSLATMVDCVVGPESALVNAAAASDNKKIVFFSHSSPENLSKYWSNTIPLCPDTSVSPCYPCHQLHYTAGSCPLVKVEENSTPVCTIAIDPGYVIDALDKALSM